MCFGIVSVVFAGVCLGGGGVWLRFCCVLGFGVCLFSFGLIALVAIEFDAGDWLCCIVLLDFGVVSVRCCVLRF